MLHVKIFSELNTRIEISVSRVVQFPYYPRGFPCRQFQCDFSNVLTFQDSGGCPQSVTLEYNKRQEN